MEHLDDKIIRNKIDSIDGLPAGYEPSLQSKWELLENALPEKKTSNRKFILAIAASFVLLIGIGGILVKNTFEQKPEIVFQDVKPDKKTNEINLPKTENITTIEHENQLTGSIGKLENTKRKTVNTITETNPEISFPIIKDTVLESVIPEEILPENNLVATSPKTKKSKKLYIEIDFNDAPKVQQKTQENLAENKVKFKVSIFKNKSQVTEPTPQNTVLKLSKEFPISN